VFGLRRCGIVYYCSKGSQRARWKANHKQFCVTKADQAPPTQATPDNSPDTASEERQRAATRAVAKDVKCACLDPLTEASTYRAWNRAGPGPAGPVGSTIIFVSHVNEKVEGLIKNLKKLGIYPFFK
jgi:hypothetical protein